MNDLNNNMTATEVVAVINGNLQGIGSNESISLSDGAADVCATLNGVFCDYDGTDELSATMSATEFVAAVNKNFGIAAEGGELKPLDKFSFLHMSDSHGTTNSIDKAISMMTSGSTDYDSSVRFFLHTGDLGANQSAHTSPELTKFDNEAASMRMLYTVGNHDANELCGKVLDFATTDGRNGKFLLRQKAEGWMENMDVDWGSTDKESVVINNDTQQMSRGLYWSKDFLLSDGVRKLRVIGIDLYNTAAAAQAYFTHNISQAQADWLVDQLSTLGKTDFFLITMHEVPLYHNNAANAPSINITSLRRKNAFCSSRLYSLEPCGTGYNDFLTAIVDAYLNGESKTITASYGDHASVTTVDFAGKHPATFIAWVCGHVHGEILTHHPDYPNQLITAVDTAKGSLNEDYSSDLRYTNGVPDDSSSSRPYNSILMNKLTIDFDNKVLTINRIGLKNAAHHTVMERTGIDYFDPHNLPYEYDAVGNRIDRATYDNDGYLIRDTITIPFEEGGNES